MNFVANFFKGLFIGIGAITPGVSGGSLAVIFGLYERITDLIANLLKEIKENFKKNFIFFLPIGLGGIVGVLGFSRIMEFLFANYNSQVKYLFIGLIIGTLPQLIKQANTHGYKKTYILPLILSFVLTLYITSLDNSVINVAQNQSPNLLLLVLYGAILGIGTIIPGISASFILMYLGAYETVLGSISSINLPILIPIGIGFVLSIVIFAKFINLLFKLAYGYTYYAILGFVIGSIIPIFPGFEFNLKHFICIILLALGFIISYSLSTIKMNDKISAEG